MPEFKKVSVKMAKAQGLALNPTKISGLCGRLMCCLGYEIDHYTETAKELPKVGSEVGTPDGKGTVVSLNYLKKEVRVKSGDINNGFTFKDYPASLLRFKKPLVQKEKEDDGDENDFLE